MIGPSCREIGPAQGDPHPSGLLFYHGTRETASGTSDGLGSDSHPTEWRNRGMGGPILAAPSKSDETTPCH